MWTNHQAVGLLRQTASWTCPLFPGASQSCKGDRHYKISDGASSAERGTWYLNAFNREKVGCPGGFRAGAKGVSVRKGFLEEVASRIRPEA